MGTCYHPYCEQPGVFVHRWKSIDTGDVVREWSYCPEHNYPRYPNKRYGRMRERDGSLTQFVRVEKA